MAHDDPSETLRHYNELGQLASGVGHHVINAFSTIVSNAEILRLAGRMPNAVDPTAVADLIVKTAVEASGVARRLIDFSRLATATGSDLVALDRLARDVIETERAADWPGIEWMAELEPVPPIRGHEPQLRAMLGHLIANAYEAMVETGGGTITLATYQDDRGWVVLEVRDTGPGMPLEIQERAVEPFFTTKPGRLGIGLSIANGIWRRHRGTLAVRSTPGEGTRARLCVEPARPEERSTTPGPIPRAETAPGTTPAPGQPLSNSS
ncbi:MAG: HAMP domain-containing histidine kinase [Isosphaeraceae bacterium]|nr:HAMP domain-containing histidine kinase [Isosphaeraceae bacterium]